MKYEIPIKRIAAYLIDMIVFAVIILLLSLVVKDSKNIAALNLEMNSINELALNHEISFTGYISRYASVIHDLDREKVFVNIVNCVFIMIYFVFIPYFFEGRTLGKKIMGLKIVRNDGELLMLNDLVIRNLIINGLGFLLISLCLLYFTSSMIYFLTTLILGILQIILVFISVFMIIYRKDSQGIHDILSETKVVKS